MDDDESSAQCDGCLKRDEWMQEMRERHAAEMEKLYNSIKQLRSENRKKDKEIAELRASKNEPASQPPSTSSPENQMPTPSALNSVDEDEPAPRPPRDLVGYVQRHKMFPPDFGGFWSVKEASDLLKACFAEKPFMKLRNVAKFFYVAENYATFPQIVNNVPYAHNVYQTNRVDSGPKILWSAITPEEQKKWKEHKADMDILQDEQLKLGLIVRDKKKAEAKPKPRNPKNENPPLPHDPVQRFQPYPPRQ